VPSALAIRNSVILAPSDENVGVTVRVAVGVRVIVGVRDVVGVRDTVAVRVGEPVDVRVGD
jgi:hypothetical protein